MSVCIFVCVQPCVTRAGSWEWTGERGESLEAVCSAGEQQGFPADIHPHTGDAALLLHARPWLRRLAHHDLSARTVGICHRHPQTPALGPHRAQPGEQEPPQIAPPKVSFTADKS